MKIKEPNRKGQGEAGLGYKTIAQALNISQKSVNTGKWKDDEQSYVVLN